MNIILFLSFIFVFIIFIYLCFPLFYKNIENFMDKSKTALLLINKKNAEKEIRKISTFGIHHHYIHNLSDWTNNEIQLWSWLRSEILRVTPREYRFLLYDTKVAKFNDHIEMGFPHTNGDVVYLTNTFITQMLGFYNKGDIENCMKTVGLVVYHELIHIWQRKEPNFFKNLYAKWGFVKYTEILNFDKISNKSRYNPDGVSLEWCYKLNSGDEILPISIYTEEAQNISNVETLAISIEKVGTSAIVSPIPRIGYLSDYPEFKQYFGYLGGNNYHPNEISAEIISVHIVRLVFKANYNKNVFQDRNSMALNMYKKMFNEK